MYLFLKKLMFLYSKDASLIQMKCIQRIFLSNKCCCFFTFYSSVNLKNKMYQSPQKHEAVQVFPTLIIIRNVSWAANQYIIMISEELWCWKFKFDHRNKLHFTTAVFNRNTILKYYCFVYFLLNKCSHGEHKRLILNIYILKFKINIKIL